MLLLFAPIICILFIRMLNLTYQLKSVNFKFSRDKRLLKINNKVSELFNAYTANNPGFLLSPQSI